VDRDEREIGFASRRVKAAKVAKVDSSTRARARPVFRRRGEASFRKDIGTMRPGMTREILLFQL